MDYDDNDFQSQNFQLGAEDNKFPLPKFDIDEHLQVHLRFDSLVDTDVLLGIHNQDNNWIEDFSSGNSAIEFNPSAAKTHTVSRHTNVWSEATSSESVEMLLKSVGEDEMSNNKAIAMESDLQNVSSDLINPVNPTSKDDNNYMMETFVQDDPSKQPDKVERDLSDHNTDAGEVVKQHPESIGDVLVSHDDLSKDDAQKVSLPFVESTVDPLVMVKDNVSEISDNCDSFLESIACQVEVFNKESKAVEIVGEEHTEIINQNVKEVGNIEAATEVNSPVDRNPNTLMKYTEAENSSDCDNSKLETQTHETEIVVVEKTVEVNIVENTEEFGSKLVPQENAVPKIPFERLHGTAEDVASSVSTDGANLKSDTSLIDKAEVTIAESEDKHLADVGSGFGVPYFQESTYEAKSHLDGPLSENRSSEQKETTPPKSHAYNCVNVDVKEIKITEDVPSNYVQVPAFEITATTDLVLEQIASEVSNQLSSDGMNSNGAETSKSENSNFAQLESNVDDRLLEDPDICENKLIDVTSPTIGVQHSCHVENADGTQCKFQLQSLPDKPITKEDSLAVEVNVVFEIEKDKSDNAEASPDANIPTVYGKFPSHSEDDILSTFSPSAVEPLITQGDSLAVEENVVSEIEKDKPDKSDDVSSQIALGVQHSCHVESSDGTRREFQHYSLLDKQITEESLSVEENTVSSELSRHSEENIMSAFSPSAVKPPITQGDSLMIEENIASEIVKDNSDKSDDVSPLMTLGAQHSCHVESSDGTLSDLKLPPMADKPITREDYAAVEENTISRKETDKSNNSDTAPNANMQTVYGISGEFPSHREENILSTFSPSAVKLPITEGYFLAVEENTVFEIKKDESNKSDDVQLPCHVESSDGTQCKFQLQPLPEKPFTQKDSPVVEENTDSGKEKDKFDDSVASLDANMQTVYGEFPSQTEEIILPTLSPSALKPPIIQVDSPAAEENIASEKEKDKSDKLDDVSSLTTTGVQHSCQVESSDGTRCKVQLQAVPDKPNIQEDSPAAEDNTVSGKEKNKPDNLDASPDTNMRTVYGAFPSHSEENILSTLSPTAVNPPIIQRDSPAAVNIVSEKKSKSDKSDNERPITTTGAQHSYHVESSDETRCKFQPLSLPNKPIAQKDSPEAEENIVSEKEQDKSVNSAASLDVNMQTVYDGFPDHSEENILSTPSPSALKPPSTQADSPAVEETAVSEKAEDKSDKSEASPNSNMHTLSSEFGSHIEENILSTPSLSYVKPSETHLLTVETGKTSAEPSCGSSTIINISIPSHDNSEGDKIDTIKHTDPDSKKSIATEDDKSFSFEVRKAPDMADNNTGNQWKPFPDVLSSDSPKTPKETTMVASEKKSTKSRAKSTKGTATRKVSSESAGIPYITPSASVGTVSSGFQLEEVKLKAESSRKRKTVSPIIQTSSLPDLNSSVSASALLRQPFSDIQQVQLRAQIFVYGSLIQGIPPDEACMQSAFGEKDGGRSIWETTWRKSVDRYQTQKTPTNQETPILPHSAVRTPSQETKSGSFQSKVSGTSAGKYVGKSIAPAIASTPLPLQSPVWNMPSNFPRAMQLDFDQASSPLHPYPSPQTKQFTNNTTPWIPSNLRPAQWAISAQSPALKSATQYSSVLAVDTVKVTPIRESSVPHTSMIPSPMPVSIPLETQGNTATPQKSRKRKKAIASEEISNTVGVFQSTPAPLVSKILPTIFPFAPLTINATSKVTTEPVIETASHISPPTATSCQISTGNDAQIAKFSEEKGNKVEQAKQYAEEAAAVAASVVSHGQGIWNQIAAQKNSSLPIDAETKLASAAAAATAAASVAKAAASAAKVAFEAVVQAKVMADEAINSAKTGNHMQNTEAVFDAGKNLAMLTPGSILKGKDKMHGSSMIISAACDAARKRVEEASAASKRAENLNAIMKAAELAAEAVSHVGTIIAMGDPLPFKLSELVEAGPEGCWKSFSKANKLKDLEQSEKTSVSNQETHQTVLKDGEQPVQSEENCDGLGERTGKSSTLPTNSHEKDSSSLEENTFRKGSLMEVISDEDGLKGGWFSARVLDVEDNRVHVCYNNLLSDDGPEQLKEWVSLDSEINGAPRIRIAHPRIVTKNEGTKKRRREAANNYVWEVGDHVDAWMRDGWWEGIVTEKNQLDETKLTVHFPAGGDHSLVRAWDLRTSLTWKDGQWTEWSREEDSSTLKPYEGDTPQEKRRKLGKIETDVKGATTLSKEQSLDIPEIAEASRSLKLSRKETTFSLGKKEDNKPDAPKGKRTDPHKEGSGAVSGAPKGPAKKQKFMDVSKHYGSDKADKSNQGKDPLKFPKYLMPQASRPWRNTSKTDPRGKRAVDPKPTAGLKPARPSNSNARSVKRKDSSNTSVTSASNDENPDKNYTEDSVSSRPVYTESLVAPRSASRKKAPSVNEGERGVKRRFTPSGSSFRSEKNSEGSEKDTSDANEPRRSSRKIQPTSRLLEGLQSSMMMSRIPSFAHNKSSKTPHRSSSSRGNTR